MKQRLFFFLSFLFLLYSYQAIASRSSISEKNFTLVFPYEASSDLKDQDKRNLKVLNWAKIFFGEGDEKEFNAGNDNPKIHLLIDLLDLNEERVKKVIGKVLFDSGNTFGGPRPKNLQDEQIGKFQAEIYKKIENKLTENSAPTACQGVNLSYAIGKEAELDLKGKARICKFTCRSSDPESFPHPFALTAIDNLNKGKGFELDHLRCVTKDEHDSILIECDFQGKEVYYLAKESIGIVQALRKVIGPTSTSKQRTKLLQSTSSQSKKSEIRLDVVTSLMKEAGVDEEKLYNVFWHIYVSGEKGKNVEALQRYLIGLHNDEESAKNVLPKIRLAMLKVIQLAPKQVSENGKSSELGMKEKLADLAVNFLGGKLVKVNGVQNIPLPSGRENRNLLKSAKKILENRK